MAVVLGVVSENNSSDPKLAIGCESESAQNRREDQRFELLNLITKNLCLA